MLFLSFYFSTVNVIFVLQVRTLKSAKATKANIDAEVKILLSLKQEYKQKSGKDWAPVSVPSETAANLSNESDLLDKISKQGDIVRQLKTKKADKATVDQEVKILLQLKEDFKKSTGKEWKPNMKPAQNSGSGDNKSVDDLVKKVTEQGNIVRDLKANKAKKVKIISLYLLQFLIIRFQDEIDAAVKVLLQLKTDYKTLTGTDFPTAARTPSKPKETKVSKEKPAAPPAAVAVIIIFSNFYLASRILSSKVFFESGKLYLTAKCKEIIS